MLTDGPQTTADRVREVLRRDLNLPADLKIDDDAPLFGGQFDLDSLDALMIVASVEKAFGIKIPNEKIGREALHSVGTLSAYLDQHLGAGSQPASHATGAASSPVVGGDLSELLKQLPHGEPFRFVSSLEAMSPGESGQGTWAVHGQEDFFKGHFPCQPVVPGVLIAEALAQLSGIVAASGAQAAGRPRPGSVVHIDVRYRQPAKPPAKITLDSQRVRSVDQLHEFKVSAQLDGQVLAEGNLSLRLE